MSALPMPADDLADDLARARAAGAEAPTLPRPLPDELPPVQPFPIEALPDALRPWAADVAERMQCPPDFVAVPLIVSASALAARVARIRLRRRDDWTECGNLWAAIVGRPGAMKSPAMRCGLEPLHALETAAAEAFDDAAGRHRVEALAAKLRADAMAAEAKKALRTDRGARVEELLADVDEPAMPTRRRYIVNAPTWEKLHALLAENPGGLLMERDELAGWFHDMGREEQAEARSFFVQGWSGGRFTVDRIGRGTVTAEDMRLSIIGAIQPGPLAEVLRSSAGRGDDGLIERFLVSWPDDPGPWRDVDRMPDLSARERVHGVFARLDAAARALVGGPTPCLALSEGAHEAFAEWRADLERRLRAPEPDAAESALAKFRHHVPALALTLHLVDSDGGAVSEAAMLRALALGDYFESHARRLYSSGRRATVRAATLILGKLRVGDLGLVFTAREVYRSGWSGLTDRERVHEALDVLVGHGWLTECTVETGGRPTTHYSLADGARRE